MHKKERIERWMQLDQETFARLGEDRQASLLQSVAQAGKLDFAQNRMTELSSVGRRKPPLSKDWARGIVIAIGCVTFSASSGQVAKQSIGGAFVVPVGLIGGVIGGLLGHEMASSIFTGLLLKNSTAQARRSLYKRQP
jgi:hypothetical protein